MVSDTHILQNKAFLDLSCPFFADDSALVASKPLPSGEMATVSSDNHNLILCPGH